MADILLAVLVVTSTAFFFVNVVLSCIAGATEGIVFKSRTGDVSHRHKTLITPIGWTFMIWNLIYLGLVSSMIYLTYNIVRNSRNGLGKVYCNPAVFSKGVSISFILNQVFYIAWLFVWDMENMTGSAVILLAIASTNWITFVLLSRNLLKVTGFLNSTANGDLWVYRVLVQNSLGMYTAWTTLAAHLNFNIAVIHDVGVNDQTSSLVCLSVLTLVILVLFVLDIFVFDRYVRYLLTPYFTFIWGLTGIRVNLARLHPGILKSAEDKEPVIHFVSALLALMVVLTFTKVTMTAYRHRRKPLIKND